MKFQALSSFAATATLVLVACSNGGRTVIAGQQCPTKYDPIPMEIPDNNPNKIVWEKSTSALPPGEYKQVRAELYYVDSERAPNQNFRVRVVDALQKDGSMKPDMQSGCLRNTSFETRKLQAYAEGVSHMLLDNNKAMVNTETRNFGFRIGSREELVADFSKPMQKPGNDPGSVYGKTLRSFIFKQSETDYELRSQSAINTPEQKGTMWLSVTLRLQPPSACPAAASPYAFDQAQDGELEWQNLGQVLPAGVYDEKSTAIYFQEDPAPKGSTPFRLHVKNTLTAEGVQSSTVDCQLAPRNNLAPVRFTTESVTRVQVSESKAVSVLTEPRRLSFRKAEPFIPWGRMNVEFKASDKLESDEGLGQLARAGATKISDTEYEVRTEGTVRLADGRQARYWLATRLVRR